MTALSDELQRTLGAAFTIERELGGGGMSTVFVARDNALGRAVVVKVLPYELAATVSVDRFKREIMLSAALQHPHIVPVRVAFGLSLDVSRDAEMAFATPKSVTVAVPDVSRMLSGLMSR